MPIKHKYHIILTNDVKEYSSYVNEHNLQGADASSVEVPIWATSAKDLHLNDRDLTPINLDLEDFTAVVYESFKECPDIKIFKERQALVHHIISAINKKYRPYQLMSDFSIDRW